MRDIASAFYHSLHPSGTPPSLPIPAPSTSRRADIPEADTSPRKRLLLTTARPGYEIERIQTRQDKARSEAYCRALEARVTVLETKARHHEWQRQAADDLAVQYIMRTQALEAGARISRYALEAGARIDTLEDTGSSS
ncbi:hypothetical protein Tco_1560914 [Tanacetum coccineum]